MIKLNNIYFTSNLTNKHKYNISMDFIILKNNTINSLELNKLHLKNITKLNNFLDPIHDIFVNYNLPTNYIVIKHFRGHSVNLGAKAGQSFNNAFYVFDTLLLQKYILMYVEPQSYTKISYETFMELNMEERMKTWYLHQTGYVGTTYYSNNNRTYQYLHQYIMQKIKPNSNPVFSVDHINHDKLDNRIENLRWATQSEQNINRDKIARHHNAQNLPEDIPQQLPKYVTFNTEIYNKETGSKRSYFRIEGHPLAQILWSSSKSNKVFNLEKYNETLKRLHEISQGIITPENKYIYPIGIRIDEKNNVFILDYKDKESTSRYNLKMRIDNSKSNDDNFDDFKAKILIKYPNFKFN